MVSVVSVRKQLDLCHLTEHLPLVSAFFFSLQKPYPRTLLSYLKKGVLLFSVSSIISSIILRKKISVATQKDQMIFPTCPHWSNTLLEILSPFSHLIPNFLKIRIKSYILGSSPWLPQLILLSGSSESLMALDYNWMFVLRSIS